METWKGTTIGESFNIAQKHIIRGAMETMHWVFNCSCGKHIWLPTRMLGLVIVPQDSRTKKIRDVGLVCPHCKQVRTYSREKESVNFDSTSRVVVAPQTEDDWAFAGWLECEEKTCSIRLPLFSPTSVPTGEELKKRELSTWGWGDDLKCPNRYAIHNPSRI